MPLDPRLARFLTLLAATGGAMTIDLPVAARRAGLAQLMAFGGPPAAVQGIDDRSIPGPGGPLPVRLYIPSTSEPRGPSSPGLIYFHGGGWVAGSIATHDGVARALAQAARCRILSVDYRLAPEHPFPAAIEDAQAAVEHVATHAASFGIDPARLGICGDSAGATLAAATCQARARAGRPALALQLLICPLLDVDATTDSRRDLADGHLADRATLAHDLLHYLPRGTDLADPRVSPLRATDLSGTPPTLVHAAEYDPLRDEARHYFDRLTDVGAALSYTCHPGMIHLFYGLGAVVPYARTAFEQIGGEIRAVLG